MREIVLCAAAFSLSMLTLQFGSMVQAEIEIEPKKYSMMTCESLHESDYSIEAGSGKYKAAGECFFGGYYPLGPTTRL